jgi:hypothetical protein
MMTCLLCNCQSFDISLVIHAANDLIVGAHFLLWKLKGEESKRAV